MQAAQHWRPFLSRNLRSPPGRIGLVQLKSALFTYTIDGRALPHARLLDGKLLLVTITPNLMPDTVVKRYKSLVAIERGFRVPESDIEISTIHHWLFERIRAHAAVCLMVLMPHRITQTRLHAGEAAFSPQRSLTKLRRIQHHRVSRKASMALDPHWHVDETG